MQFLAISLGGAVGALLRYYITQFSNNIAVKIIDRNTILSVTSPHESSNMIFPWGTLIVNLVGSFLIGVLFVLIIEKSQWSETMRLFLIVGFLGAFTTFSSFSIDNFQLLAQGEIIKAIVNIVLNVSLGLLLVWLGIILSRNFL